MRGSEKGYL
jgi:hypothetical protein